MSELFRGEEEEEEDDEDNMDISPLCVPQSLILHSPSWVHQRKRNGFISNTRTSRCFSPTQIINFHKLTIHSPKTQVQKKSLLETKRGKRPLSPSLTTKQKICGDPQRHVCKRRRTMPSGSSNVGHREELCGKSQAKEMQERLGAECPFFMKSMIRSSISSCCLLTLPRQFCRLHLPLYGTTPITLETKEGKEFETNYLAEKTVLSGGWKRFCHAEHLCIDDLLVFRLVSPLRFKVYKVRPEYDLTEKDVDAAFHLLRMSASEQTLFEQYHGMPPPSDITQETCPTPDTNLSFLDDDESNQDCTTVTANLATLVVGDCFTTQRTRC